MTRPPMNYMLHPHLKVYRSAWRCVSAFDPCVPTPPVNPCLQSLGATIWPLRAHEVLLFTLANSIDDAIGHGDGVFLFVVPNFLQ